MVGVGGVKQGLRVEVWQAWAGRQGGRAGGQGRQGRQASRQAGRAWQAGHGPGGLLPLCAPTLPPPHALCCLAPPPDESSGPLPALSVSTKLYARPDRSYIIIGGLGGFGVALLEWLYEKGARHIVVTSRSGVKLGTQMKLIEVRGGGRAGREEGRRCGPRRVLRGVVCGRLAARVRVCVCVSVCLCLSVCVCQCVSASCLKDEAE